MSWSAFWIGGNGNTRIKQFFSLCIVCLLHSLPSPQTQVVSSGEDRGMKIQRQQSFFYVHPSFHSQLLSVILACHLHSIVTCYITMPCNLYPVTDTPNTILQSSSSSSLQCYKVCVCATFRIVASYNASYKNPMHFPRHAISRWKPWKIHLIERHEKVHTCL